jgi:hypothetical protein
VITPQNVIEPSVGIHGPSAEGVTPPTSPGQANARDFNVEGDERNDS